MTRKYWQDLFAGNHLGEIPGAWHKDQPLEPAEVIF
jgi:hypothetical protein